MIRIVGVQRNDAAEQEFVLLQNQGSLRMNVKGHAIVSQDALDNNDLANFAHIFNEEALIPPGMYVILYSGQGSPKWSKTKDGGLVYYAYMNRTSPVWDRCASPLHVLSTQHTYSERAPGLLLR